MRSWWESLAARSRLALLAGLAAAVLLLGAGAWWLLRSEPAVLFSDLRPQDAAVFTAELDKLKIPYDVADNGATLLVDRSEVHAVRMKLMGRDLPLHGTVGLELFNNTDFGMTEFAQKINFQRALQGELTRTILSFPEVRDARVHLALAEQGLFKQHAARAKAAVTLTLRAGQSLRSEQVHGIQRLVAAAVPGLASEEVTIVDQQGVALSRPAGGEEASAGSSTRLDLKRETENYLSRKAAAVLDKAFGPGQALASVDVTLNMDQVRVTTEDVIAAPDRKGGTATGVLVRERESARDSAVPEAHPGEARGARGSSMQRDVEYQAGRRVEQVVSQPGAIRRIQVVAVVRQKLDAEQKEQLTRVVAAAVGASTERGDTVVVQLLQPVPAQAEQPATTPARGEVGPERRASGAASEWLGAGVVGLALLLAAMAVALRRRQAPPVADSVLTDAQRRAALQRVQTWLLQSERPAHARTGSGAGGGE